MWAFSIDGGFLSMGIIIAGAGSVGLLLGSFLAEAGIGVTMFVRRSEQAKLLAKHGIERVNADGTKTRVRVDATSKIDQLPDAQLWIIAVKYAHLTTLLAQIKRVKTPLLFIQNGIGHISLAKETSFPHFAFATIEHGALRTDDRTVIHNGIGPLTIGTGRGNPTCFNIVEKAQSELFPVLRHCDGEYVLMRKVIINCMINPLTAILQVKNGELLTDTYCFNLFTSLYDELMTAFPEMKDELPIETVENVCIKTARNRSSMLMDRVSNRPMEIDTIVSAVIRKAEKAGRSLSMLSVLEQMLLALDGKEASE